MKNKNTIQQLSKTASLFMKYGLHSEQNRKRIVSVLNGEFKPFFGIDSTLYLNGHRHKPYALEKKFSSIVAKLENEQLDTAEIDMVIKSNDFLVTLNSYKRDLENISNTIKSKNITVIGLEATAKLVNTVEPVMLKFVNGMIYEFKEIGLDDQCIKDIILVYVGPVRYTYLLGIFPGLSIIGVEGSAYSENIGALTQGFDIRISEPHNMENVRTTGELLMKSTGERNIDIAQNIEKYRGANVLVVIGDAHVDGIKKLMGTNWKVKTSHNI